MNNKLFRTKVRTGLLLAIAFIFSNQVFSQNSEGSKNEKTGIIVEMAFGTEALFFSSGKPESSAGRSFSYSNLKAGKMISGNCAFVLQSTSATYTQEGSKRSFETAIPLIQYWIQNRLWLAGGTGFAFDYPALFITPLHQSPGFHWGSACCLSSGYEFRQTPNSVMHIQARLLYGATDTPDSGHSSGLGCALLFGFCWF